MTTGKEDYLDQIAYLRTYHSNLQTTGVKFLFFYADNLDAPKVRDDFKLMNVNGSPCYLVNGVHANFYYVFRESHIKYLVSVKSVTHKNYATIYNVAIQGTHGKVNHGDHIDFGIIKPRSSPSTIVKTHRTVYRDLGNYEFDRTEDGQCNFPFDVSQLGSVQDFLGISCTKVDGSVIHGCTMGSTYASKLDQMAIYRLCRAMMGYTVGGGKSVRHVHYRGERTPILTGRKKGTYVMHGGTKRYLKGGGNYKGVSFMTDVFIGFLRDMVLRKVAQAREDLNTIQILFDELNEFGENANEHIVIIYDFHDGLRNIFYLKTTMMLKACYADSKIQEGLQEEVTQDEMNCLRRVKEGVAT